jgi:hypothetical protein
VSETPQDRELERYLQGKDPLSRAYDQLRAEMPSPEMDSKVLAEARAAVTRARRFPRWQSYAAIAATVVLAFGIVLRLNLDQLNSVEVPVPARSMPAPESNEVSPDMSSSSRPAELDSAPGMLLEDAPLAPAPATPGAPVYTVAPDDFRESSAESPLLPAERSVPRAKTEVGPTKEAAAVGGGTGARLQQRSAPVETASQAAPVELRKRNEPTTSVASGSAQGIAAAAGAEQEPELKDYKGTITVTGSRVTDSYLSAQKPLEREAWLKYIEQLREDGKTQEAEAEMRRFLLAYPGYRTGPGYKTGSDPAPTK